MHDFVIKLPTVVQWRAKGGCVSTPSLWGRTATGKFKPDLAHVSIGCGFLPELWFKKKMTTTSNPALLSDSSITCSILTCELLHWLQPDTDGLMGEQRGGGQRAWHALHYANMLHALSHWKRGHVVVSFKGTVAVYAATCRMGGRNSIVWDIFLDFK